MDCESAWLFCYLIYEEVVTAMGTQWSFVSSTLISALNHHASCFWRYMQPNIVMIESI